MNKLVPTEFVENKIFLIRGCKVMIDRDLAQLYQVSTKSLNQAVKRNIRRFPLEFMFQLNDKEFLNWRSQIVTSNSAAVKMGVRRYPYAFTEQGVAMLSSVLKSEKAIQINILIIKTFVRLRRIQLENKEIFAKLHRIGEKVGKHDVEIGLIIKTIEKMMLTEAKPKRKIGFLRNRE